MGVAKKFNNHTVTGEFGAYMQKVRRALVKSWHYDPDAAITNLERVKFLVDGFALEDFYFLKALERHEKYERGALFFLEYRDRSEMALYAQEGMVLPYPQVAHINGEYFGKKSQLLFTKQKPGPEIAVYKCMVRGKRVYLQADITDISGMMKTRVLRVLLKEIFQKRRDFNTVSHALKSHAGLQNLSADKMRTDMQILANNVHIAAPYLNLLPGEERQFLNLAMSGHDMRSNDMGMPMLGTLESYYHQKFNMHVAGNAKTFRALNPKM